MSALGAVARAVARPRNDSPVPLVSRYTLGGLFRGRSGADPARQLQAMGSNGTLFSIVDVLAETTASVEWHLYRKVASGKPEDRVEVQVHAALDLIRTPNPWFSRSLLMEAGQQHFELVGEICLLVGTHPAMPSLPLELWPVRPDRLAPIPHPTKFQAGWVYTSPDGEQVPLKIDQVIHIRRPNPVDPYRGIGAVQSVLIDLDAAHDAAVWNRNFFKNSASPGGVVEYPDEMSDPEFNQFLDRWRTSHQGVQNVARVAMLERGMKWVPSAFTQKDMQFAELRNVSRDVLREAFHITKFALGDVDDINRATAEASASWFGKTHSVPRLNRWREAYNTKLLPRYGATATNLEFDYITPVEEDRESARSDLNAAIAAWTAMVDRGADPTEALEALSLPKITITRPAPAGEGQAQPAPGDPDEPDAVAQARAKAEVVQKLYLGVDGAVLLTSQEGRALLATAGIELDAAAWAAREAEQEAEPEPEPDPFAAPENPETSPGSAPGENPVGGTEPPSADPAPLAETRTRPRGQIEGPDDVDLTRVQEEWERAVEVLLSQWTTITTAQNATLVEQVRAAVDAGDIAALTRLSADSDEGAALLLAAMGALAELAAAEVVREAEEQGADIEPVTPEEDDLRDTAILAAAGLAAGLALSAGQEAGRVYRPGMGAQDVADAVAVHLDSLTDARPREVLGGALTGAQNEARTKTFTDQPTGGPIASLYASEVLDKNTCGPCSTIHGRFIATADGPETPDEVRKLYPQRGYVDCLGRDRCRGTIVGVWRSKTAGGDQ